MPLKQATDKLINIVYNKSVYYLCRPGNLDKNSHVSLIENYAWLVAQYMPQSRVKLVEGDIVRFGRIPFQLSKIVLKSDRKQRNDGPG